MRDDHPNGNGALLGDKGPKAKNAPALLVSYAYLKPFIQRRASYLFRDWALDSGAFTAHAKGKPVCLQAYTEKCLELLAGELPPAEVFSLDVIGDWKASAKNTDKLWSSGVPAIPAFHVGSPEAELKRLAKTFPKIALGGAVGFKRKDEWAAQCFARVWPAKIHGFGFGSEASIMALPWHSVDATNWEIGPCAFGSWRVYGKMSVRGASQDLRAEIEWYLDLERKARARWRKEMKQLESLAPTIRLASGGGGGRPGKDMSLSVMLSASGTGPRGVARLEKVGPPSVRLACDAGSGGGKRMRSLER